MPFLSHHGAICLSEKCNVYAGVSWTTLRLSARWFCSPAGRLCAAKRGAARCAAARGRGAASRRLAPPAAPARPPASSSDPALGMESNRLQHLRFQLLRLLHN